MQTKRFPLWLLRDIPALIAVMLSFWPMVILLITLGRALARGKQVSARRVETLGLLLAIAETRLDHALWRQAYRLIGWRASHATLAPAPLPNSREDMLQRATAYLHAFRNMNTCAHAYADALCQRHGLRTVRVSPRAQTRARFTRVASRPHSGRPSTHAGERRTAGAARARAPPTIPRLQIADCRMPQRHARLRMPPRVSNPAPRRHRARDCPPPPAARLSLP